MPWVPVAAISSAMTDAVAEVRDAQAAVLLGDHPAEQPEFAGLAPGLPADHAGLQPLRGVRDAFLLQERPHHLPELLVLVGEDGPAHGFLLRLRWGLALRAAPAVPQDRAD